MDTSPVSCRTLERFYHVDANTLEKQYKDVLSGRRAPSKSTVAYQNAHRDSGVFRDIFYALYSH